VASTHELAQCLGQGFWLLLGDPVPALVDDQLFHILGHHADGSANLGAAAPPVGTTDSKSGHCDTAISGFVARHVLSDTAVVGKAGPVGARGGVGPQILDYCVGSDAVRPVAVVGEEPPK